MDIVALFLGFLDDNFIYSKTYNIINTPVYILVVFCSLYVITRMFKLIDRNFKENYETYDGITPEKYFILSTLPYSGLFTVIRLYEDLGILEGFFLRDPIIYLIGLIISFGIFWVNIYLCLNHFKEIDWRFLFGFIGIVLFIIALLPIIQYISNWDIVIQAAILMLAIILLLYGLYYIGWSFFKHENISVFTTQIYSSLMTYILQNEAFQSYSTFPELYFKEIGLWTVFPLKIIVIATCIFLIEEKWELKYERRWTKILLLQLGILFGLRDFLRILTI